MLHNIVVTNYAGHMLLAKYFDHTGLDQRKQWERQLFRQTVMNWGPRADGDSAYQVASVGEKVVVFGTIGEMIVFLAGSEDYDEFALTEILTVFVEVLGFLLEKKLTEKEFASNYGKVCVAIDEICQEGEVEHMDVDTILKMSKLKPLKS